MPMKKLFFYLLILWIVIPATAECQIITGPEVKLINNDIFASFSLSLDEKHLQSLREGMEKEFVFYVDLFRVWNNWPDEFVLGKTFTRTLRGDPVRKEFVGTNSDSSVRIKKRFRTLESMIEWAFTVRDLKLTSTRELEAGQYFVKITVESKVRKLPPVIGYLFIFVPENEFRTLGTSGIIQLEGTR